jgi:hypothetical protein
VPNILLTEAAEALWLRIYERTLADKQLQDLKLWQFESDRGVPDMFQVAKQAADAAVADYNEMRREQNEIDV